MKTVILEIDPMEKNLINHPGIIQGGKILKEGGLVAFPTETVYGLGANGLDSEAVKGIYKAKDRPSDNPLILHIVDVREVEDLALEIPDYAKLLMERFWPGPITLVLKKQKHIPDQVAGGLNTVAIRMPSHPIARALIVAAGVPIAAPSANRSSRPSPTLAEHVIHDLAGRVEMIIDGGPCQMGIESTVIDCTGEIPMVLRPGSLSVEEMEELVGTLKLDVGVATVENKEKDVAPKSPGMKYRHYSPEAQLLIIEGEDDKVQNKLIEILHIADQNSDFLNPYLEKMGILACDHKSNPKLGILATKEMVGQLPDHLADHSVKVLGSREDLGEMAASLFRLLREFDEEDVDLILAEGLPLHGLGLAVMNRLRKAAGYQIIQV